MSALASDIEDERRPLSSQTSLPYRPTSNSYEFLSSQYIPTTTNSSLGQINSPWMIQQQQQYHRYQEPSTTIQRRQLQSFLYSNYAFVFVKEKRIITPDNLERPADKIFLKLSSLINGSKVFGKTFSYTA